MNEAASSRWPLVKRLGTYAFFLLVAVLLAYMAKNVEWRDVLRTLRATRPQTLFIAAAIALASYLVYAIFDVLGKIYTGHPLRVARVIRLTFVCYAFNLNLSSWVGSIALRYRLYSRFGLATATITRVFVLSWMTNWLGYLALAGVVFASGSVHLPAGWTMSASMLRVLGGVLLAVVATHLALCAFSKRRSFFVRGYEIGLPSWRLALAQLVLGALNWNLMALIIFLLLERQVDYPTVLGVLLVAALSGVIAHIPAGLGVLEAVFVALLQHRVPRATVLAALIGYRALYYLLPLVVAVLLLVLLENEATRGRRRVPPATPLPSDRPRAVAPSGTSAPR